MKRINLISTVIIALSVTIFLVISPLNSFSQKQSKINSNGFPGDVSKILSTSCISCHGDGGKKMAMSMWNFNKWETYPAGKQSKKALKICKAINKGKMPPVAVKKSNPESIPTAAQIDIICKWANSLNVK